MKRDDDLIRALMLDLEEASQALTGDHKVDGYSRDQVAYHLAQIVRAGFADGPKPLYPSTGDDPTVPFAVIAQRLTPSGHDYISTLRDAAVWARVKAQAGKIAGGATLAILKELGAAEIKRRLGLA